MRRAAGLRSPVLNYKQLWRREGSSSGTKRIPSRTGLLHNVGQQKKRVAACKREAAPGIIEAQPRRRRELRGPHAALLSGRSRRTESLEGVLFPPRLEGLQGDLEGAG